MYTLTYTTVHLKNTHRKWRCKLEQQGRLWQCVAENAMAVRRLWHFKTKYRTADGGGYEDDCYGRELAGQDVRLVGGEVARMRWRWDDQNGSTLRWMSVAGQMIDRHVLAVPQLPAETMIGGSFGVVCCAVVVVGRRVSLCDRGPPRRKRGGGSFPQAHARTHTRTRTLNERLWRRWREVKGKKIWTKKLLFVCIFFSPSFLPSHRPLLCESARDAVQHNNNNNNSTRHTLRTPKRSRSPHSRSHDGRARDSRRRPSRSRSVGVFGGVPVSACDHARARHCARWRCNNNNNIIKDSAAATATRSTGPADVNPPPPWPSQHHLPRSSWPGPLVYFVPYLIILCPRVIILFSRFLCSRWGPAQFPYFHIDWRFPFASCAPAYRGAFFHAAFPHRHLRGGLSILSSTILMCSICALAQVLTPDIGYAHTLFFLLNFFRLAILFFSSALTSCSTHFTIIIVIVTNL